MSNGASRKNIKHLQEIVKEYGGFDYAKNKVEEFSDRAIAALAQQIVHRDPEEAFSWASTIQNQLMREQTVSSVFAQWAIRHPREAAERLNKTDFPAEQVSKLRLLVAPNLPQASP